MSLVEPLIARASLSISYVLDRIPGKWCVTSWTPQSKCRQSHQHLMFWIAFKEKGVSSVQPVIVWASLPTFYVLECIPELVCHRLNPQSVCILINISSFRLHFGRQGVPLVEPLIAWVPLPRLSVLDRITGKHVTGWTSQSVGILINHICSRLRFGIQGCHRLNLS